MILVIGATGRIGREVVSALHVRGEPVRAFVRDLTRAREVLGRDVEFAVGDLQDASSVQRALAGIDKLFLVSSTPELELTAVAAAESEGLRHVVKSSAIGFGSEPPAAHGTVERALAAGEVPWTVLRPNAFLQTLQSYLPRIVDAEGGFALPAGTGRTAWVDVRDIADVAAAVLTAERLVERAVLVTGAEPLSMTEVARIVTDESGHTYTYRPATPDAALSWLAKRVDSSFAGFLVNHYESVRRGGFEIVADSVLRLTGQTPRTLADLVRDDPDAWRHAARA